MRRLQICSAVVLLLFTAVSCFRDPDFEPGFSGEDSGSRTSPQRSYVEPARRVMIMISGGYNSLSGSLTEDLEELESGYLPEGSGIRANVLLVLARTYRSDLAAPVLYRLYKEGGKVQCDTLRRWSEETPLCQEETLHDALSFIQRRFPECSYGIVFSSHASGWLPEGYYADPFPYERNNAGRLRSLGQDVSADGKVEMELQEFVDAIPMHLEYLLIDACLSGCVEVAYAFKDKADVIGFSPAEVLADGFNYPEITRFLLQGTPDPIGVCRDYFDYYDKQTGSNRSATISVVDTRKMDNLAVICRELFEKYRTQIAGLDGNNVQRYFRFDKHFFYDLKDILVQAGITAAEESRLDAALAECVLYKAATPGFLVGHDGFFISHYSGLSMYLPSMGTPFLDSFYKTQIAWNETTQLVK